MQIQIVIGDRTIDLESVRSIEIGKADTSIDVDVSSWPVESIAYALDYGLKQSLNDSAAAEKAGTDAEVVLAKVNKRLDALAAGTVRQTGGRIGDSVKARAVQIAMRHAPKGDPKEKRAWALAAVSRNPAFMSLAQSQIDQEKALEVEFGPAEEAA